MTSDEYSKRVRWLRLAVLKTYEGLLWAATLMMGVEFAQDDEDNVRMMIIIVFIVGIAFGASAIAIWEFLSLSSQFENCDTAKSLGPSQVAMVAGVSFAFGAVLLLGAAFIGEYTVRMVVVVGVTSIVSTAFGILLGVLGKAPVVMSALRFLIGGWLLMAIAFGFTKFVDAVVKEEACGSLRD
ncbi:vacuolar iron transporter homolog 4-like [Prosopis cineraria]|uniref:vacuolar iron transporter homolog 4-like n=1 Tax=Prosopis cineraria TaxID=364024 RepID=UPI0024102DC7|nr:vacuolar iron transporter homolog 4-like [Prosopis cineraria]